MYHFSSLAMVLVGAGLQAQGTKTTVLPKGLDTRVDSHWDFFLGTSPGSAQRPRFPMRMQTVYNPAELPAQALKVQRIAWRRNNYFTNTLKAEKTTLTVTLDVHPTVSPTNRSNDFSKNLTAKARKVFSGTVNWPATPFTGRKVNAPFDFKVPLPSAYVLIGAGAKGFVVDVAISKTDRSQSFLIDATGVASGVRTSNPAANSKCKFSTGTYNNSISFSPRGLTTNGGTWQVTYNNVIPNSVGVGTLSGFGVNNAKTTGNPFKLPIDLGPFGGTKGCTWNVGLETGFWVAFKTSAPAGANKTGRGSMGRFNIPAGLKANSSFFEQALILDAKANSLGFQTTWSSEWKVVSAFNPLIATVYQFKSMSRPSVFTSFGAVLQLTY